MPRLVPEGRQGNLHQGTFDQDHGRCLKEAKHLDPIGLGWDSKPPGYSAVFIDFIFCKTSSIFVAYDVFPAWTTMGQGRAKDATEGHPGAFNGVLIVHSQYAV